MTLDPLRDLKKYLASGDTAGASVAITQLYDLWDTLDAGTQQGVKALEGAYLSMIRMHLGKKQDA